MESPSFILKICTTPWALTHPAGRVACATLLNCCSLGLSLASSQQDSASWPFVLPATFYLVVVSSEDCYLNQSAHLGIVIWYYNSTTWTLILLIEQWNRREAISQNQQFNSAKDSNLKKKKKKATREQQYSYSSNSLWSTLQLHIGK